MKARKVLDFVVNFCSLKNGEHEFHFEIKDDFFSQFEGDLVEKGEGFCTLNLRKSDTMMRLKFKTNVTIELMCDRSLEKFNFPISNDHTLIVKFGEKNEELSEDLIVVNYETQSLDLRPYIFEFICIDIPMKKLHPKFEDQDSPNFIYKLEANETDAEEIDPRWEVLKKLSKN